MGSDGEFVGYFFGDGIVADDDVNRLHMLVACCYDRPADLMSTNLIRIIWTFVLSPAWHCIVASLASANCDWNWEFLSIFASRDTDKLLTLWMSFDIRLLLSLSSRIALSSSRLFT